MVEKNPIYEQLNQLGAQISSLRQKLGATPNQWEKDALQKQIDALTEQRSMMLKYEAALPRDTEQVESKPGVAMFGTGGGAADIKEAQKEAGYERNLQAKWSGIIPVTGRNQLQNAAEQIIQNWTQGTLPNAASAIEGFVQQGGTLEMLEKGGVDVNAKPHEWVQSMKGNTMSIADAFNNDASYKNTAEYKTRQSMAGLAGTAGTPTVSQSGAPTYKFASSPELADIEKKIQGVLVKTPELTPDMVTKWQEKLNLAEAPFEQQAIERLRGEYNIASPYSYGSGTQMAATRKMITEQEANKAAKALSLGQQEYEAQRSDYDKALQRSIELETYKDQASRLTTDQERTDYWNTVARKWQEEDTAKATAAAQAAQSSSQAFSASESEKARTAAVEQYQRELKARKDEINLLQSYGMADQAIKRQQELEDWNKQKSYEEELMNKYLSSQPDPGLEFLSGLAGTVLSGAAGGIGKGLAASSTKKPASDIHGFPGVPYPWES